MGTEEKKLLNEETLADISGGLMKASDELSQKKAAFEKAWDLLGLDAKGYSGMRMAQLFDDWELADFKPDAVAFLKAQLLS